MRLAFNCPGTGRTFSSESYDITENRGVVADGLGNKTLDANVVLTIPCPYCGELHTYRAADLPCPFSPKS